MGRRREFCKPICLNTMEFILYGIYITAAFCIVQYLSYEYINNFQLNTYYLFVQDINSILEGSRREKIMKCFNYQIQFASVNEQPLIRCSWFTFYQVINITQKRLFEQISKILSVLQDLSIIILKIPVQNSSLQKFCLFLDKLSSRMRSLNSA